MNIRHLTFRLLQVYIAVVRTGSISQAAQQLHLTQPTVSQQIKRLSEAIGEPLLEVREGQYHPTFVGEALYQAAQESLARFEDFASVLHDAAQGKQGHFSLGVVTTAKYLLPRLLGAYSQIYPHVDVTLNIGNRSSVLQRFNEQQDDLYLFSHPPTGENVVSARFLNNPLVLIAPSQHWAAQAPTLGFSQLCNERFLMREQGSATRMVFESWLRANNYALTKTMQIESNEVIRMGVESGMGIAVLSEHTLAQTQPQVAALKVSGFPLQSHWYFVRHGNRHLPAAARNFMHYISNHLPNLVDAKYRLDPINQLVNFEAAT